MIKLKIDNKIIEVKEGTSILNAAKQMGIKIPTMCWHKDLEHFTSCMVCLVKDEKTEKLIASCSVKAEEGMQINTMDEEIRTARKTALELLLSEHVGDCEAPCQIACPAHMDIPKMNRLIANGKLDEALEIVMHDIALPSVLGRICPAPCEGACHRKTVDEAVSICLLKRIVGDQAADSFYKNLQIAPSNGKKIAIIGAGPAGLAAAFYLQIRGYDCTIFEQNDQPGGFLLTDKLDEKLPKEVLYKEINNLLSTGIQLNLNKEINLEGFLELQKKFDVVIVASGAGGEKLMDWGLEVNAKGIEITQGTFQTNIEGVFAIGNALRSSRLAVRSVGQGKELAFAVDQYLQGKKVIGEPMLFNSRFGRLVADEYAEYLKESVGNQRIVPDKGIADGFSIEEAKKEAARCLHCDCRKFDNCTLRDLSEEYKANQKRFSFGPRKNIQKVINHDLVIYEPQKCIKCGICVRLTEKHGESFGFTFIGRGFDVVVGVPFNEELKEGIAKTAQIVVESCPTGALAMKE